MSRRPPNPAAERAAQNQQTLKSLLKLETNKTCADCKRNKHPRWASWNLGVFICIRCSGVHRGMGTHISRVKSVDLDAWTDEQLQSILKWGNARANKYWESKLAAGHAPSEAKIENFIRTKYELKRWVMDGPMPDPSTLGSEGDDDVPLSVVKEKQNLERKESLKRGPVAPPPRAAPQADLIGGDDLPPRASTAGPSSAQAPPPPKAAPAPPKVANTKDSLLGLDFLGEVPAAPPRPSSTSNTGGLSNQSRPDLKQSILSLYASAPRPQPQTQQSGHASQGSFGGFGGMQSAGSPQQSQQASNASFNDAFASLSFGNMTSPTQSPPPQRDAFAGLGSSMSSPRSPPQQTSSFSSLGGGSFFDAKPSAPKHQAKPSASSNDPFAAFGGTTSPKPAQQSASSGLGDMLDWSSPAPQPAAAKPKAVSPPAAASTDVFNLSSKPVAAPAPKPVAAAVPSGLSGADVWGSNAWGAPEPAPAASPAPPAQATPSFGSGWGSSTTSNSFASQSIVPGASGGFAPAPKVAADEEFGGWTTSTTTTSGNAGAAKTGGNDDLFSNVWQ
ncbi:uncharacterized protein B0I36DRAFT_357642 [Microdochium trichocladiopsis]|uniref:Arf-GAP domain-containing protein n=1 Tax=Microdochium trichocladiopsis TaxID=1682393 RepID=A0A9P8YJT5_9PEZI|nr:uncharacterized protein B0I36DRAFT_357642 [Microdochium trichocladiopsis]KAH7040329.1 hypothetical protein B0I36DRAFT_357642 [Microdochium trichocladiopsis]